MGLGLHLEHSLGERGKPASEYAWVNNEGLKKSMNESQTEVGGMGVMLKVGGTVEFGI